MKKILIYSALLLLISSLQAQDSPKSDPIRATQKFTDLATAKIDPLEVKRISIETKGRKLPNELFECLNLEELELVNTSLKKLPSRLSRLAKLKSIYVYNNESSKYLKLGKNKVVKYLLLRGMEAKELPKSYKKFSVLTELDLSRNIDLTDFPDIYKNKKLEKLNLLENQITLENLKQVPIASLKELNLQKNRIRKVPDAIANFSSIKKLTFNYNQIAEVSPAISKLKELEELSFYQNKLKEIPQGLYEMSNLKVIDLYYNEIERVEPEIRNLENLEVLYLSNNRIASLPDNIGQLTNLRELYLSNNRLFNLPVSLSELKALTIFRINNNKLSDFPSFVLDLPELENIDISYNNIRVIPNEVTTIPKLSLFILIDNPVNEDEVNLVKIVEDLTVKGVIVHQNKLAVKVNKP